MRNGCSPSVWLSINGSRHETCPTYLWWSSTGCGCANWWSTRGINVAVSLRGSRAFHRKNVIIRGPPFPLSYNGNLAWNCINQHCKHCSNGFDMESGHYTALVRNVPLGTQLGVEMLPLPVCQFIVWRLCKQIRKNVYSAIFIRSPLDTFLALLCREWQCQTVLLIQSFQNIYKWYSINVLWALTSY